MRKMRRTTHEILRRTINCITHSKGRPEALTWPLVWSSPAGDKHELERGGQEEPGEPASEDVRDQQFTAARFHKLPKENGLPEGFSCDFGSQGCRFEPCRVQIKY